MALRVFVKVSDMEQENQEWASIFKLAQAYDPLVLKTSCRKRGNHLVTYRSGVYATEIHYI